MRSVVGRARWRHEDRLIIDIALTAPRHFLFSNSVILFYSTVVRFDHTRWHKLQNWSGRRRRINKIRRRNIICNQKGRPQWGLGFQFYGGEYTLEIILCRYECVCSKRGFEVTWEKISVFFCPEMSVMSWRTSPSSEYNKLPLPAVSRVLQATAVAINRRCLSSSLLDCSTSSHSSLLRIPARHRHPHYHTLNKFSLVVVVVEISMPRREPHASVGGKIAPSTEHCTGRFFCSLSIGKRWFLVIKASGFVCSTMRTCTFYDTLPLRVRYSSIMYRASHLSFWAGLQKNGSHCELLIARPSGIQRGSLCQSLTSIVRGNGLEFNLGT